MSDMSMETMGDIFNKILHERGIYTTEIPADRNYWFVRTYGGKYFDLFRENKAIGLGWKWEQEIDPYGKSTQLLQQKDWNTISDGRYSVIQPHDEEEIKCISKKISDTLNENKKKSKKREKKDREIASYLTLPVLEYVKKAASHQELSKILRFEKTIAIGDIVMIPSYNSQRVMIGQIKSDVETATITNTSYAKNVNSILTFPSKRIRRVEWLHSTPIPSSKLNPKLIPLLCSQHSLTNATEKYAPSIEQEVYPIYFKNGLYHLNIPVSGKIHKNFGIEAYSELFNVIEYIRWRFSAEHNVDLYSQEIELKLSIQSPGITQWISKNKNVLAYIAVAIIAINGGTLKGPGGVELSSPGLLGHAEKIYKYKKEYDLKEQDNNYRKFMTEQMKKNEASNSEDLLMAMRPEEHFGVLKKKAYSSEDKFPEINTDN